jgi:hypothetical protein
MCINSIGINLAIEALGPLSFINKTKTRRKRKRKETHKESIILKYPKAKKSKLNATKIHII